jgi:prepilin-type N-terminal cleavage/methylation domain-containing protein
MCRRSGVTLTEVLVAIFIMGIGLLALLVLFPLGALTMAQAVKDDRTAHAAASGIAMAKAMNVRNSFAGATNAYTNPYFAGPGMSTTSLPDLNWYATGTTPTVSPGFGYDGPSYPAYVDPLGNLLGGPQASGVGSPLLAPALCMPRRGVPFATTFPQMIRWFTIADDMNFLSDGPYSGLPCPPTTGQPLSTVGGVQREGRYSWAYLMRRPNWSYESLVDTTVIVYSGRNFGVPLGETPYGPVQFDSNSDLVSIQLAAGQQPPPIRRGTWILDATTHWRNSQNWVIPEPHGYFYRVVGVNDTVPGQVQLQLQTKARQSTYGARRDPATGNTVNVPAFGVLVVMENVAEVFERGEGWEP